MEFRVLGPFEVIAGGTAVELGGPKQRAVLALLALRANEVVPMATIIDALWDAEPPRSAVAVVRTYVSRLRQAVSATGEAQLTNRPPGYVLETDVENVDAHRFEALVAAARRDAGEGRVDAASVALDRALALWRGDVLSDLPDLPRLGQVATRLAEMRLAAIEDRIDAELALGRHAEAVGELEALTSEHAFRERFWGQLIVALYRSGRQTDALAAYQTLRSNLVEHVGVEPGPELRALERAVLAQADDLHWRPPLTPQAVTAAEHPGGIPLPPAVSAASQQPLAGRGREHELAMDWFDRARGGQFGVLFVAGPPGIGKSALAAHVARDAHRRGAVVVLGRADEDAGLPYQPLAEAIAHWASHAEADDVDRLGDVTTNSLGRIVPALAERAGGIRTPPAWQGVEAGAARRPIDAPPDAGPGGGVERQRLFESIARWIEVLAANRPAIVVLEDLQWADPATLLAVRHLLRHPPAAAGLLLATHRQSGAEGNGGLASVLASAGGQPHVGRAELGGLADEDVAELVRSETGHDLDDAAARQFAARLSRETGGNPLFVIETIRHLTEQGALAPAARQWPGDRPLSVDGVPMAVTELIDHRLRRLPATTAAVLRPASMLGDQIEVPVLSRVAGRSRIDVVDALEPALDAGLVEQAGSGIGRFRFSHALVREAILHRLPPGRRARLHWQVGQALASLPEPPLGEIARHFTAGVDAGDTGQAVAANVRAGQRALGTLAFEEAFDRFGAAADLLQTGADADDELAYDAWIGLGHASGAVGDHEWPRTGYLRAAAVARERGWPDRFAQAAIGFATFNVVHGGASPDDDVTASRFTDEALAGLGGAPTVERCLLLALRTMRAVAFERPAEARMLVESAREIADALAGDATAASAALLAQAWALVGSPHHAQLREAADRALVMADRSRFRLVLRRLPIPLLATPPLQVADMAGYDAVRRRVASHPELGPEQAADTLSAWDAAIALSAGRFADAERLAATGSDYSVRRQFADLQAGAVAVERGAYAHVSRSAADHASAAPTAVASPAVLAWLRAEVGDRANASSWVDTLRRQRSLDELGWGAPLALRCLAETAAHLGDRALAGALLPVLSGYAGQMLVPFCAMTIEGAADRAIGVALLALGRHDEAIARLAAALRLEESVGASALATRTAYWHTRALLARGAPGDADAARRSAGRTVDAARRLGMSHLATLAAALADQAR